MNALKQVLSSAHFPLTVSRSFSNEEKSEKSERSEPSNNSDLADKNGSLKQIPAKLFETEVSVEKSLDPLYIHTALQTISTVAQTRDNIPSTDLVVINAEYIPRALHYSKVALNLLLNFDPARRQDAFTQLQRLCEEGQRGYHATKTLQYSLDLLLQELFTTQQKAYETQKQEPKTVPEISKALQSVFDKLFGAESKKCNGSIIEAIGQQRATKLQKAQQLLQRLIGDSTKKEKAVSLLISCLQQDQMRYNAHQILRQVLINDHKDRPLDEHLFNLIHSNDSAMLRVVQEIMDCYRAELEEAVYPQLDEYGLPDKTKPGTLGASSREDPAQILLFRVIQNGYLQTAGVFQEISSRFTVKKDPIDMARHLAYCVTYQHKKFSSTLLGIYRSIYKNFQLIFDIDYQKWFLKEFKQSFFPEAQGRLFVTQQIFLRSINPFILSLYNKTDRSDFQSGQMTCYRLIQKTLSTNDLNRAKDAPEKRVSDKKPKKEASKSKEEKEAKEKEKAERMALKAIQPILRDCSQKIGELFLTAERSP